MSQVDDLVQNHNRDELDAMAEEAGVEDPQSLGSKKEVAQAIVDAGGGQPESGADEGDLGATMAGQGGVPGAIYEDETLEDVRERQFESTFGHLEGDELENARNVAERQWEQEDAWNAETAAGVIQGDTTAEEEEEEE